jgi:hypothetical protein
MLMFHVRAFRWHELGSTGNHYNAPGIFEYFPLLSRVVPPEADFRPVSIKHDDGEFTVPGVYPGPRRRAPRQLQAGSFCIVLVSQSHDIGVLRLVAWTPAHAACHP